MWRQWSESSTRKQWRSRAAWRDWSTIGSNHEACPCRGEERNGENRDDHEFVLMKFRIPRSVQHRLRGAWYRWNQEGGVGS